jgi:hypothetical protein
MSAVEFFGALMTAFAMGALCWVACSYYTRLWNKRFRIRLQHHLLCAVAAVLTVIFTVHFRAVGNLTLIVDDIIDNWSEKLVEDSDFYNTTFETAYYAVKEDYPNEFTGVPEPGMGGSYIPLINDDMKQMCVETYVEAACSDFSTIHPFLNIMLSAQPGISEDEIKDDMREYFKTSPSYPPERAIKIAAEHIRESLREQSPKTVWKTRWILAALFVLAQMLPFGTIGYFAYKDLKIAKVNYSNQQITY